jgi:hypothetical protein
MAVYAGPDIVENGLVLHLDAANRRSYPGTGTGWFDLSGNGNNVILVNGPSYSSSNNGFITFDGTNDCSNTISTLNLSNTNAVTLFYIMKANVYTTLQILHELSSNFNNQSDSFVSGYCDNSVGSNNGVLTSLKGNIGYNIADYNKSLLDNLSWCSLCIIHDTSQSSKENLIYKNSIITGEDRNPVSGYSANNTNNFGNRTFYIGSRNNSEFFASMSISCLLLYNRRLSDFEIQQNFNALRGRFNL